MIRSSRHGGFDFRDIYVLVVEDEEFARALTNQVLRGYGCAGVMAVENGNLALDVLTTATRSFDLIICDFRMPKMNGLELLKAIRKGVPGVARDIPFAMLTSHADKPVVGLAFELDVDCFLIKPITAATMRERLTRVMASDRTIKKPFDYYEIDTDRAGTGDVMSDMESVSRAGATPATVGKVSRPGTKIVSLAKVRPGSVLVDPVVTSGGQQLLPAGSTLDTRTVARLRDLAEMDASVREVHVED
ncbi:MAG: response regulator [Thalassobaculaceae bacterium]|nr:response regulator [Thalassobaculaceae bacterium]